MRISSRTGFVVAALALSSAATLLAACGGDAEECRLGADCASGQCSADGLCVVGGDPNGTSSGQNGSSGNASSSSGGGSSSGSSGNQTSSSSSSSSSSGSSGSSGAGCVANLDGIITKEEVPQMAGLVTSFKFAADVDVSLAGTPAENGQFTWDFTGPYAGDHDVTVETKPAAGSWYASNFPDASYSVLLGQKPAEARGVLRVDATALSLLGVISNSDVKPATGETNMKYDKAVTTLQFPLQVGATWKTESASGSGVLAGYSVGPIGTGLYGTVIDTYESTVDKRGALTTTYGIFPVLRVVTKLTRASTNYLLTSNSITVAFVTECGGTIAKITSEKGAANGDFTHAVEIQRLALVGP